MNSDNLIYTMILIVFFGIMGMCMAAQSAETVHYAGQQFEVELIEKEQLSARVEVTNLSTGDDQSKWMNINELESIVGLPLFLAKNSFNRLAVY